MLCQQICWKSFRWGLHFPRNFLFLRGARPSRRLGGPPRGTRGFRRALGRPRREFKASPHRSTWPGEGLPPHQNLLVSNDMGSDMYDPFNTPGLSMCWIHFSLNEPSKWNQSNQAIFLPDSKAHFPWIFQENHGRPLFPTAPWHHT